VSAPVRLNLRHRWIATCRQKNSFVFLSQVMSFQSAVKCIVLLAFMLEVVHPTTTFVRENSAPLSTIKIAKTQVTGSQTARNVEQAKDVIEQDENYLSCSAILPSPCLSPELVILEQLFASLNEGSPQDSDRSIQRPPSRT